VPLGIGDKDLARGLMASKYITIKNKGVFMKNENINVTTRDERKLPNTLSQITFEQLNEIDANELGRSEIETIVKKMKQSIDDGLYAYLHEGKTKSLPFHINLYNLDELLSDPKVEQDEIIDELSLLATVIILFNLSRYYKNSLLSSSRNDHHSYMLEAVNSFANKFYGRHMIEGLEFYIVRSSNCIMDYEMNFLLYWLEVATKEEWTI